MGPRLVSLFARSCDAGVDIAAGAASVAFTLSVGWPCVSVLNIFFFKA